MIWLRRVFTIPLILLFVFIFIALLFTTHLSGSLGGPGFYKGQLPGAARFAYMAGLSGDGTAKFYLKQCRIGS